MNKVKGKYQKVSIEWIDSTMRSQVWWNAWDILEDIDKAENKDYMYSTGYLFKTTKTRYYLANSIHFQDGEVVSFGQIFCIPKGCVIKIIKAK